MSAVIPGYEPPCSLSVKLHRILRSRQGDESEEEGPQLSGSSDGDAPKPLSNSGAELQVDPLHKSIALWFLHGSASWALSNLGAELQVTSSHTYVAHSIWAQ